MNSKCRKLFTVEKFQRRFACLLIVFYLNLNQETF